MVPGNLPSQLEFLSNINGQLYKVSSTGCSLTWQDSRSTACALLSDDGDILIQAFFQALQPYSWGFALIQSQS